MAIFPRHAQEGDGTAYQQRDYLNGLNKEECDKDCAGTW